MAKIETKVITRTALLLALTIVFQGVGRYIPLGPNSNFIVGPLVNACLFIATALVGVYGGVFIAVAAPLGAILTGAAIPIPFVPFIALGNLSLVIMFHLFKKKSFYLGIITGSFMKFIALYVSILGYTNLEKIPAQKAKVMIFTFGWPQLVTALLGGGIALIVIRLLFEQTNKNRF